ncbi:transporter substrate-binding domain-containing protein [Pseudooceanicola sp. GBMRC 2024]|uniref:Transporter substrate-binding domain-containing protein n=2 Tax=Paracoccaceae TaxID=31989 RepID=A0A6L7G0I8_9RHOB|nr:transporter substrate-binding domain-containing protein [Pseudooceanicola albus]
MIGLPGLAETLKVGSTPTGVPFTFLDVKSGQVTGMMVDVVKAVGEKAGFTAEVKSTDWVSLIPALTSGRIDIISAAMSITDARKKVVDFSDPIFPYGEGLVMRKDDPTQYTQSLKETAGKTIGVQQGTRYLDDLKAMSGIGTIKVYENIADIMRDVQLGRIAVGFADQPIMAYQIGQGKFPDLQMSKSYKQQFVAPLGLAINKDHPELLARINKALAEMKQSGELDALIAKWNLD